MTVITNMVVALMIVTQGEEPVKAIPYTEPPKISDGSIMYCNDLQSYLNKCAWGDPETLYRKTCKTNFVYSADVNISPVKGPCEMPGCDGVHQYTIDELFKCPIRGIYFETSIRQLCEKHKYLQYLREVGK